MRDDVLEVFVSGRLRNPLNGSWGGWAKHARLARDWRERTAMNILAALPYGRYRQWPAAVPKLVTFTAHVGAEWDEDNLPAAIKPIRDALRDMQLVDDDRPSAGHTFRYEQRIDRANPGVAIRVELAPTPDPARGRARG